MATKERMLELFENNKGVYFSGEEIAEKMGVSRTAIWKAVKALQNEGYSIDAVQNKGYCLSENTDILSVQGIEKYLSDDCAGLDITVMPVVASTNTLCRERAEAGAAEGCCIIANCQTGGRGRRGRGFFSPADTGVYMSIVLRPDNCPARRAAGITTVAAVAVCEAIEAVSGKPAEIKWVNDVFVDGKKVCGILTEASFGMEDGMLEYAILGIGINVSAPDGDFPEALKDIAGSVFTAAENDAKNRMAAEILNRFMKHYAGFGSTEYINEYRKRCFVLGKQVRVITPDGETAARALDIDDECHLIVEYEDGSKKALSSGEISVRMK